MARVVVVGTGIVGLAVAARLAERGDEVVVLEKEDRLATHQTGRNSGVIHSGIYYAPGSLKARLGRAGAASMRRFALDHGVAVQQTGKLIVATAEAEVPRLRALQARAAANEVEASLLDAAGAREHEPHVAAVAALHVPITGIVDYPGVCDALAGIVTGRSGTVRTGVRVLRARTTPGRVVVETTTGEVSADAFVNCAGLHSDRLAAASGLRPQARIVPFRGEYFELAEHRTHLVRGLIYPVPDPRFPFLGVHLTRMIGGGVHAGPNAVLALAREGYRWRDVSPTDVADAIGYPGLWRLGARNVVPGAGELLRSLSRRRFAASLARLVPGIEAADLEPAPAGVRAQALRPDGGLVDDFLVQTAPRQVHVLNAPSPAATAALEIAAHLERELDAALG
ncbi:L-2-hydroxyglutarate oxidase [Cellulomonas sp. S1-8]|uniref:L-2-hydroxyglutarate oxidase n=1 Tax=Cellulomonas sp. S1-8 TaxID=2904790 RepID=UPI002242E938|nr:L-2-hydroxyglutarate oxidase [Cellulomonas sp. S1-8]UZN01934.1 L-2-hydroxyglutarate oxidase [Cellulomonas sp. S1-8]